MILITDEQNNCVEAFQGMAEMSYKLAAYLSANVLDSDRNKLTKQMYDHYMQQAEETDLKKLSYPDGFQGGNSKKYTDLKNRILELNESYHRHDISEVSDEKYDSLFKELIDFEKNNDFLDTENSPTKNWFLSVRSISKYSHRKKMLSLDNAFSINDLTDFNKRVNPKEKFNNLKFSCEPKMDGVAISIRYKDGFFILLGQEETEALEKT